MKSPWNRAKTYALVKIVRKYMHNVLREMHTDTVTDKLIRSDNFSLDEANSNKSGPGQQVYGTRILGYI